MKMKLLSTLFFVSIFSSISAQAPTIDGDILLCPNDTGTASITSGGTYYSYQWYFKYWFLTDDFQAINNATSDTFVYDWQTYDQALLKVVVTIGANTYESNTIQIDSYAWSSIYTILQPSADTVIDSNGSYLICDGDSVASSVGSPYSICQWYKDGQAISGATDPSYLITDPGEYYVIAAPSFCPNATSTSLPIYVYSNTNCDNLSIDDNDIFSLQIYPNPVTNYLSIKVNSLVSNLKFSLVDMKGCVVMKKLYQNFEGFEEVSLSNVTSGVYTVIIESEESVYRKRLIKE